MYSICTHAHTLNNLLVAFWLCGACVFGLQWWMQCSYVSWSAVLSGVVGANIPQLCVVCTQTPTLHPQQRPLWDTAIVGQAELLEFPRGCHFRACCSCDLERGKPCGTDLIQTTGQGARTRETERDQMCLGSFNVLQLSIGRTLCSSWAPHGTLAIPLCHSHVVW